MSNEEIKYDQETNTSPTEADVVSKIKVRNIAFWGAILAFPILPFAADRQEISNFSNTSIAIFMLIVGYILKSSFKTGFTFGATAPVSCIEDKFLFNFMQIFYSVVFFSAFYVLVAKTWFG